jgi:hypothetical protein
VKAKYMEAVLEAMAQARGITKPAVSVGLPGDDPSVMIGNIAIVMEPGCYQVFRYHHGFMDAIGEPHETFNSAASFALDAFVEAA